MTTYGVSGISPLGTYGLGAMSGYGSYDMYMPSTMMGGYGGMGAGMNAGMGMMTDPSIFGMGMMGGYGGYGMMNYPLYYSQMQNQVEMNQLQHAIQMQQGMNQYGVSANLSSDKALIEKITHNGDIRYHVDNLRQSVVSGNQDGIMKEFTELRNAILNTYGHELDKMGTNINRTTTANEIIKQVYAATVSAQYPGTTADLEADIKAYGDGAFKNGFMQGLKEGSHKNYTDETLMYCFGRDIDQKQHKDVQQKIGKGLGHAAQVVKWAAIGAGTGAAAYTVGGGALKGLGKTFAPNSSFTRNLKFKLPTLGKFAVITGLAVGIGDIIWQIAGNKSHSEA